MKKPLIASYIAGITDRASGESYSRIFLLFFPEFITALVLYSLVGLIDAQFIAHLKSTSLYATVSVTNTLVHFITKIAEGLSVGTIVLCGYYNGRRDYLGVGRAAISAFWVTACIGLMISLALFWGAEYIFTVSGMPAKMVAAGVPFLRLRAVAIFFMFLFFALVGFLRGVKNTRVTMHLFVVGAALFLLFDYLLIFGKGGFPALQLQGSAWASVIQYVVMFVGALFYALFDKSNHKYNFTFFALLHPAAGARLLALSWPVMLDKATLAAAKLWLVQLMVPMGKEALGAFGVIKDMEMLAFIPAIAFGQVITLLISNEFGAQNWQGIKDTIKKVLFLSSCMVGGLLLIFSVYASTFIRLFDLKGAFTSFAAQAFPLLSVLVFFDLLQLILSGALRGAANVKVVMWVRIISFLFFFLPLSYIAACSSWGTPVIKFVMIYGSFYIGNALMSMVYIYWFRSGLWKNEGIQESDTKVE